MPNRYNITYVKANISKVIQEVTDGNEVIILRKWGKNARFAKAVAKIVPYSEEENGTTRLSSVENLPVFSDRPRTASRLPGS